MTTFRSTGYDAYPNNPAHTVGKAMTSVFFRDTVTAAASADGDVHVLAGPMSFGDRIAAVKGATPALTSADDNDLGFYKKDALGNFIEVDKDILWDGADLSSAISYSELLATLNTSLDTTKNIGDLLALGNDKLPAGGVYLCLTTNTASTATSVVLDLEVVIDKATTS